jgi:predicted RNA-binding protein with TRAM domain
LGYRYKVFVDDESDDRSSGIAKIGRLVTFIPGARRGQTAIVDVTRVRDRVADAVIVNVLSQVDLPPKAPRTAFVPLPGDSAGNVIPGAEMDVVISEASSKNPTTEGVAKVNGLIVFVNGATTIGERVNVRITERRERMAFAEPTGKPAGTSPLPIAAATPARGSYQPLPGDSAGNVIPGAEMDVVISEASSKNPTTEGVARINGLVVFVNGATTIGQRVNVRITERRERVAFAEPTGKPAGEGPLASTGTTGDTIRRAFAPGATDPAGNVIAGAEMDVVITEISSKNPTTEGVARVNGLVVFVEGATTIGERVNVRITARRERMAFAERSGKPAGTDPLPVQAAPAPRPPRAPRAAFVPPPGDSAAHVVPGTVIATTITEASSKNPTTEGVAKVNGLVVFVKGATTIGQAVNVRIVERRERIAIGEVTTDAPTPMPTAVAPVATPAPAVEPAPATPEAPAAPAS